jgi:hypothetical protein
MVERRRQARLDEEALAKRGVLGQARCQELQRHRALQGQIVGAVDDAHAAAADQLLQPVAGDLGADDHCLAQGGGVWCRQAGAVRLGGGSFGLKYPPNVCSTLGTTFSVLIDGMPCAFVATRLR